VAVSIATGVAAGAGAISALANFVEPLPAACLGVASGTLALYGALKWERRQETEAAHTAWAAAVTTGPAGDGAPDAAAATDSLLAALNPDSGAVPFSPLRGSEVRALVTWCCGASDLRVWRVAGDAGSGKTCLLGEADSRLDAQGWRCGWVRRGKATDAVAAARLQDGPVLLIVDDADTQPDHTDLAGMLTDLIRDQAATEQVRIVLAARDFGGWWGNLRAGLDPTVHAQLRSPGDTRLSVMGATLLDQQQLFAQAVGHYARHFCLAPPAITLTGITTATSLAELHAAAASAARHGLTGTVAIDDALQRLFATEEIWWQNNARDVLGVIYPLTVLQAALAAATLIGADSMDQMARRLRCLPGLTTIPDRNRIEIALWLHQLYAQRGGEWLDPHLPARLADRYAAGCVAAQPALAPALAAAALLT
jgi:hypothetical protein